MSIVLPTQMLISTEKFDLMLMDNSGTIMEKVNGIIIDTKTIPYKFINAEEICELDDYQERRAKKLLDFHVFYYMNDMNEKVILNEMYLFRNDEIYRIFIDEKRIVDITNVANAVYEIYKKYENGKLKYKQKLTTGWLPLWTINPEAIPEFPKLLQIAEAPDIKEIDAEFEELDRLAEEKYGLHNYFQK